MLHLFGLIRQVLHKLAVTGAATAGVWTYASFTGRIDWRELEAVVRDATTTMVASYTRLCSASLRLAARGDERDARLLADAPLSTGQ